MSSLLSINSKFMSISPSDLVHYISKSKYTKGVEIYIDFNSEKEKKYLNELVVELKKNNLILQIHGEIHYDLDKQFEYIKLLEGYSIYLGYPIILTLHTIYNKDKDVSLKDTYNYVSKLIGNDKVIICIENLNNREGRNRLHVQDIESLVISNNLYFTYDIGHELIDGGNIIYINDDMKKKIRNIHVHSIRDGLDHMPIYKDDVYLDEIICLLRNYKYNVVFEYGIEYCRGNTLEEKVIDYLDSIDYVSGLMED